MSNLSSWLKRAFGVPEVKLQETTDIVAQLSEQVARGKAAELVAKLPDKVFQSLYLVFAEESVRRAH